MAVNSQSSQSRQSRLISHSPTQSTKHDMIGVEKRFPSESNVRRGCIWGKSVCFDFRRGHCSRANCRFAHVDSEQAWPIQFDWSNLIGTCLAALSYCGKLWTRFAFPQGEETSTWRRPKSGVGGQACSDKRPFVAHLAQTSCHAKPRLGVIPVNCHLSVKRDT